MPVINRHFSLLFKVLRLPEISKNSFGVFTGSKCSFGPHVFLLH